MFADPRWRGLLRFAWLLVPLACHVVFSWIGFNPTDDGWLLAIARRLVDGEVPHRDFIFVRPALSAVLQIPVFVVGGEYVIWLSRLWGWLTLGAVVWIWSGRAGATGMLERYGLFITAFLLCAHNFPVMAWHSLDGMLFCTLAVALLERDTPRRRALAFFAVGLATLCRQNFAFFAPVLLLTLGGPARAWFAAVVWSALPSAIYLAAMALFGAAADFLQQVRSMQGALQHVAFLSYLRNPTFVIALLGGALLGFRIRRPFSNMGVTRWLPPALFLGAAMPLAVTLGKNPDQYHMVGFGLFGFMLGLVAAGVSTWSQINRLTFAGGLGLAWVTAISIGYHSVALMSGVLLLLLRRLLSIMPRATPPPRGGIMAAAVGVAVLATAVSVAYARHWFPYRDRPASLLKHDVGAALPGGSGLRTNSVTFATLVDLNVLMHHFERERRLFAIVTDCSAAWIRSAQRNPLPCEWPQETEFGYSRELYNRWFAAVRALPKNSRIIVQKYLIAEYYWHVQPVPEISYYFAQTWVRQNCTKLAETPYFEIYAPPDA